MTFTESRLPGVWIIEPKAWEDGRGYFMETYKAAAFEATIGSVGFVQENESCSAKDVLRGLHYQLAPWSQAKLVRVIAGAVWDVAVDLRKGSPTYGQHVAVELSAVNRKQLYIPRGFAHGFRVLSDQTIFSYKVDNLYMPAAERTIRYNDPQLCIDWGDKDLRDTFILSAKDKNAPPLNEAENNYIF